MRAPALSCLRSGQGGEGDEGRKCWDVIVGFIKAFFLQRVGLHSLTPPPSLSLIGLLAVGRGQTPTAAQSAEEAGLLRPLLLHAGDGAVSPQRSRLHPEEPLS